MQIPSMIKFCLPMTHLGRYIVLLACLLNMVASSGLQAQCASKTMACNNLVHVSLDTNCLAVISPSVVLEGEKVAESEYRVQVIAPDGTQYIWDTGGAGQPARFDTIRQDFDGALLEARVYCKASNIYCWGYIKIEDKIKPTLRISPIDTAVSCYVFPFDLDPNALVTQVSFSDNGCLKPDSLGITDTQETPFPCRDTVKIIRRTWSVVDAAGNRCDTTQTIYLLRADISELTYPRDTIIDCLDEGDISVDKLGSPSTRACEHFEITHQDIEIPVCGKARKILRRWRVTDICSTRDTVYTQVIKIEDNHAPVMDFSAFTIPVDRLVGQQFNCLADAIDIPNPIVTDCNLAQTTLEAFYQLVDESGNPTGIVYDAFVNDLSTFDLRNIPIGEDFVVIFVANDGCGNISRDTSTIVRAVDTRGPNAVCEGNTSVVLNNEGQAIVMAETFDDHSFDNCGIISKRVRRFNQSTFSDRISFSCADVPNNPIKVVFRVADAAGLTSDCVVNVYIQDKRAVSLTCLGDKTFNCDITREELISILRSEEPASEESCGITSLVLTVPEYTLTTCGHADFVVTWTATDANGLTATCTRNISIGNTVQSTVNRPSNSTFTLTGCNASTAPEDIPNSIPTVNNEDCEHIAISHEDERVIGASDHCVKIIRTWTILDWCLFDGGNLNSAILDKFQQTIVITDRDAPVFTTDCVDIEVADNDQDCEEEITLRAMAFDTCSTQEQLVYTYSIDLHNNGSIDINGLTNEVTSIFPIGVHRITFTASDVCGNTGTCSYTLRIRSTKAPIAILTTNIEVVLQSGGTATLSAASTDISSSNGCLPDGVLTDGAGLIFAFDEAGTQLTRTFNCVDVPNGRGAILPIRVWVIDSLDNKESVIVNVAVSDNIAMACPDVVGASLLAGQIMDEEGTIVAGVQVIATNKETGAMVSALSDEQGHYSFANLEQYQNYEVAAQLEGYSLTGISTLDIVLIQRHILGLTPIRSPYKLLAADVDNSQSISGTDLVELRKLILGRTVQLQGPSWRFVNRDFEFDLDYIFEYDEMVRIQEAQAEERDHDFVGLKVGDISGNAFIALAQGDVGPRSTSVMRIQTHRRGDIVRYTFSAEHLDEMIGMQMSIHLDEDMDVVALGSDNISLSDEHFALTEDALRISWTHETAIQTIDKKLLFIDVRVTSSEVPVLRLDTKSMPAEVYDDHLHVHRLVLLQGEANTAYQDMTLHQNTPNPFVDVTDIAFDLPVAGTVRLIINDVNGRSIYETSGYYTEGKNTIRVRAEDLQSSGIFYYTLISEGYRSTRRMIVLQ